MAGVSNCRRCGKLYGYSGKPVCPDCLKKEEEDFEVAREYIKENPGKNMQDVSDETGVSIKLLTKFLREGRIEFSDGSTSYLSCGTCGTPIPSGRYCNSCLSKLGKEIMNAAPKKAAPVYEAPKKEKEKMHISRNR